MIILCSLQTFPDIHYDTWYPFQYFSMNLVWKVMRFVCRRFFLFPLDFVWGYKFSNPMEHQISRLWYCNNSLMHKFKIFHVSFLFYFMIDWRGFALWALQKSLRVFNVVFMSCSCLGALWLLFILIVSHFFHFSFELLKEHQSFRLLPSFWWNFISWEKFALKWRKGWWTRNKDFLNHSISFREIILHENRPKEEIWMWKSDIDIKMMKFIVG